MGQYAGRSCELQGGPLTRRARTLLLTVFALAVLVATTGSASALTLGRTPDATWQANGRVLAILRVGGVVYIGGDFTQVMAHNGGQTAARNHLAAFNAVSGNLLAWNPNADGRVRALASAGNGAVDLRRRGLPARGRLGSQPCGQAGSRRRRQADRLERVGQRHRAHSQGVQQQAVHGWRLHLGQQPRPRPAGGRGRAARARSSRGHRGPTVPSGWCCRWVRASSSEATSRRSTVAPSHTSRWWAAWMVR